ncbi:MAG: 4-alpha-glucanotransferase [Clostridiales bacterium]|nr:4-alpha-glucanotransferase [Clostridiales bacterium]
MRASGILLPISSIPSNYGIGCFSKEAYEIVNQLVRAGQKYWQILPLGPTGYGDSPYQSFSTFAGNPYFIDPEVLINEGLLTEQECRSYDWGGSESYVDYEKVYQSRFLLLRKAFYRYDSSRDPEYDRFVRNNSHWLEDYCLYMAIKESQGGVSWIQWPRELRLRSPQALEQARRQLDEEIRFYRFQQYWFFKQWCWLKSYANNSGLKIIGDVPIYVAFDSADAWAQPELFQFDDENLPKGVAGCPPDAFSATGQLWGNPLYDWEYHEKTGYVWWTSRMKHCMEIYDMVRIDHFRGFDEYYSIPFGDETAENGHWEPGPGLALFDILKSRLPGMEVIAEDLGLLTDSVVQMVQDSGFPGMKVLQFAFDDTERSTYLPHNHVKNCVVYTGTHDNETTRGWFGNLNDHDLQFAQNYTDSADKGEEERVWALIRAAVSSVADLAVVPIQDYLCLGNEARMNEPSTLGNNWKWRLTRGQFDEKTVARIHDLMKLYGRLP